MSINLIPLEDVLPCSTSDLFRTPTVPCAVLQLTVSLCQLDSEVLHEARGQCNPFGPEVLLLEANYLWTQISLQKSAI